MSQGRCSGCGRCGASTKVKNHVLGCSDYAALYRVDPKRCLSPEAEYLRHRTADTAEARAARRESRLELILAGMADEYARQATRWQRPKDILAD